MKKFINNNMMWIVLAILVMAAAALFLAIKNSKKVKLLPEPGTPWYATLQEVKEQAGTTDTPADIPSATPDAE